MDPVLPPMLEREAEFEAFIARGANKSAAELTGKGSRLSEEQYSSSPGREELLALGAELKSALLAKAK